ncbi:MAG: hypothetical protein KDN19_16985 [Verrucomicrobiae bacterium]|nr:hypothetical protein [Verrucomicrobiae bacterium]
MTPGLRLLLITGIVLTALGITIYFLHEAEENRIAKLKDGAGTEVTTLNRPPSEEKKENTGKWVPPEGDPVLRYRDLKNAPAQERYDLISNFMALGHERNPAMLIEALKDPVSDLRVFAIESASALTEEEATAVLAAAASNDDPDAREMAWSIAAPYPMEDRVAIYSEGLTKGNEQTLAEVFDEMGTTPEMPLFEMMLFNAMNNKIPEARRMRFLQEMQDWLVPGGGEVPQFATPEELLNWWKKNRENYDEFMLRVDQ